MQDVGPTVVVSLPQVSGLHLMVVIGFDAPPWATALQTAGPEIAAAVMAELPVRELTIEPDVEQRLVVARCVARHHDHYGIAYRITEQLASLWDSCADETVNLRVRVDALQVDVPGRFFIDPGEGVRRRRWATLARSQLVHV
jgi:hypothetical protein